MKAVTHRGLSPSLERAIQDRAAQKRISLTKAAIELLEEAAGIRKTVGKRTPYGDLDVHHSLRILTTDAHYLKIPQGDCRLLRNLTAGCP